MRHRNKIASLCTTAVVALMLTFSGTMDAQAQRNPLPATAQDLSGLLDGCEDITCFSYIYGVMSGLAHSELSQGIDPTLCAPDTVPPNTLRDVVLQGIAQIENPENTPAVTALVTTLTNVWGCHLSFPDSEAQYADGQDTEGMNTLQPEVQPEDHTAFLQSTRILSDEAVELLMTFSGGVTITEDSPENPTLLVFHDQNCRFCEAFKPVVYDLILTDWNVRIFPVGLTGQDALDYAMILHAVGQEDNIAAIHLYSNPSTGNLGLTDAMATAARNGFPQGRVIGATSRHNSLAHVEANAEAMRNINAPGTPTGVVVTQDGNRMFVGLATLEQIMAAVNSIQNNR